MYINSYVEDNSKEGCLMRVDMHLIEVKVNEQKLLTEGILTIRGFLSPRHGASPGLRMGE